MQASEQDLATLLRLQEVDLSLLRSKKSLDGLPQRKLLLSLREKKASIERKQAQVAELKKALEKERSRFKDEDERLSIKQDETQAKIATVKGDYRAIEAYTRELGGLAKRRVALETNIEPINEKLAEVEKVAVQAKAALDNVEKQEADIAASFKKEGGSLTNHIAQLTISRKAALASLDPALAQL
ncbi:MAG: hypothetical protein FWE65_03650, partial [Eggerthellaceae bacterium]|nr:hypothetical protein [Eggerthellaceae bacterium]